MEDKKGEENWKKKKKKKKNCSERKGGWGRKRCLRGSQMRKERGKTTLSRKISQEKERNHLKLTVRHSQTSQGCFFPSLSL